VVRAYQNTLTEAEIQELQWVVRMRDRGHCVLCGTGTLTVHELRARSGGPKRSAEIFRLDNMVLLCAKCHARWHVLPEFRVGCAKRLKKYLENSTVLERQERYIKQREAMKDVRDN